MTNIATTRIFVNNRLIGLPSAMRIDTECQDAIILSKLGRQLTADVDALYSSSS
jgi:hypothetical protein